jgi:hypothetical protein
MKHFVPRYLGPAGWLGQTLFGLIMVVLPLTLITEFAVDERPLVFVNCSWLPLAAIRLGE